jgi:hypothetical protein
MLWIKRNLFLALGGVVALGLLGYGVFLFLGAQSRNAEYEEKINQAVSTLNNINNAQVTPSATNIDLTKGETVKLHKALEQMQWFFTAVPAEKVTGLAFRSYRDNTLAELHRLAEQARITLPSKAYAFSFETQKAKVDFKDGTFPAIPQQMAEVRALCRILFDAHVDPLVNLRRAKVSKDDEESNVATDYLILKVETNAAAGTVTSPYEVTFHCLSTELATVIQGFLASTNGFVVKSVYVEPAVEIAAAGAPGPGQPPPPNVAPDPRPRPPNRPPPQPPGAGGVPRPPVPGVPGAPVPALPAPFPAAVKPAAAGGDRPVILLKERRLRVTLLVYAIRALK